MTSFEADGVYNSIPYRVLPDCSIQAMMPGGVVKFKNMDQFVASSESAHKSTNLTHSNADRRDVPARPLDYYSILLEAINGAKQNSAQLRALVYERARFNLKRDVLFGYSSMGLADVVRQINEFELAVARIEASAIEDPLPPIYRDHEELPIAVSDQATTSYREDEDLPEATQVNANHAVQILPPKPVPPLYTGLIPLKRAEHSQHASVSEEFVRHVRFANKFIGIALAGMAITGTAITALLWPSHNPSPKIESTKTLPQTIETAAHQTSPDDNAARPTDGSSKLSFPLPSSFGIYVLSNNQLTELGPLPISIPDSRIALSAEIEKPSTTTISDDRPAFILFRRDLLNNAPQKIILRVVARITRETKIVDGKAGTNNMEAVWRIRNISRELKISPIPGQREMVMARLDDDVPLATGRYALVLNRTGYDFTVVGTTQSPVFCLEKFEAANGSMFNQCRTP